MLFQVPFPSEMPAHSGGSISSETGAGRHGASSVSGSQANITVAQSVLQQRFVFTGWFCQKRERLAFKAVKEK